MPLPVDSLPLARALGVRNIAGFNRKVKDAQDAGQPMPFIDRAVFSLERESIPVWTKFLQGYWWALIAAGVEQRAALLEAGASLRLAAAQPIGTLSGADAERKPA